MVFSGPTFLFLFLPVVLALVALLPWRWQNWMLLIASVVFYIWGAGGNIVTILYICAVGFVGALLIVRVRRRSRRTQRLVAALVLLAAAVPLLLQKYLPVALETIGAKGAFTWVLALGVSFITFHSISYLIDVKRGLIPPEHNAKDFALYLFLFPHQIAGPIVRYSEIVDEIKARPRPSTERVVYGASRFAWGLFKKTCIADNVAVLVAAVDGLPAHQQSSTTAWIGALAFALQIYFDFSGYSDMAIGIAAMLGFHFPENFAGPYRSVSVTEFWRRWHMTLSRWFRDYVYIPLGGNRHGRAREYLALIITFSLTALWHGSTWPFLVWGLLHSAALVFERVTGLRDTRRWVVGRRVAMVFFIVISWVPFHAVELTDALRQWRFMATMNFSALPPELIVSATPLVLGACVLGILTFFMPAGRTTGFQLLLINRPGQDQSGYDKPGRDQSGRIRPIAVAWALPILLVCSIVMVNWQNFSPFLYFAF